MRHPITTALTTIAVALLAPLLATQAHAAEKGLQTDLSWEISDVDQQRTMVGLQATGIQWIRMDISWHDAEPQSGVYDEQTMAMTDHVVDLIQQAGAKAIVAVYETPP